MYYLHKPLVYYSNVCTFQLKEKTGTLIHVVFASSPVWLLVAATQCFHLISYVYSYCTKGTVVFILGIEFLCLTVMI